MAEEEKTGMMDLEKELSCSICTDVLYQPLTLLDCLHTFCGACLKEWFHFQASSATSIHPYTCPSCRASVRDTRHNASVTTLLDMYLQAHPDRGKSQQDKDDQDRKYKPGENVLPKLRKREDPGADEERRLIAEAQQLSLREAGISSGGLEAPRERRRRDRSRERSRDSRDPDGRRPRTRDSSRNPPEPSRSSRDHVPARHVEHQSSLRSLLSASDLDSQEMEEEIMRQIMEEGLLDGIDLANIDVAQEDEISERIAQAYRRRQRERQQQRAERQERHTGEGRVETALPSPPATLPSPATLDSRSSSRASAPQPIRVDGEQTRRRPHGRSESAVLALPSPNSSRPPVSRPGLIDAANNNGRAHHRRSSSQGSTRSSARVDAPNSLSVTSSRQAARSAGELNDRPSSSEANPPRRRRMSQNDRSTTDPEARQFRSSLNTHTSSSNPNSPRRSAFNVNTESPLSSLPPSTVINPSPNSSSRRTTDPTHARPAQPTNNSSPALGVPRATTEPSAADARPATSTGTSVFAPPTLYPEPEIVCNRCGKTHIEYDLHYNCALCDNGNYNICLDCYRSSKGCKHWFGFGHAAWRNFEQKAPPGGHPANYEQPHVLVGHRYKRPSNMPPEPRPTTADQGPARRLESGVFCDMCSAFASSCYWKCDICNEGGWGFCNDCVNQGRHCTHPLLPLSHNPLPKPTSTTTSAPSTPSLHPSPTPSTPPLTPKSASLIRGPGATPLANQLYRPLTFSTCCDICTYPIPPSHTRFHCPRCQRGDYDICTPCYHGLVASGRIAAENGPQGWRRCLRGHRMVVVGFEDRAGGQRRVVSRDLVGGLALRDEDGLDSQALGLGTPGRFPPDGGVGLRVVALWARFPREGVEDELMFPKFAEIREAEDINGDWFWGCYAGAKGLFPGNFTRVV
ncbi:uncharacterized protein BDZ99DRAFT_399554 [Mytilinidion resinicola]|uniref:RING-type domain-containing protein n=1 Tax=Mytilinidion resinicola TaxID=574789 RepID=A0A6A6Y568_9PEZI|nr:uncharacterized protein BDZ99DRAFT_399554 [Mytilinidion resinicola]KAF2803668.1 hypothetical protein BDZ99DRAFT_399554 [Mytilinidion resinicola]